MSPAPPDVPPAASPAVTVRVRRVDNAPVVAVRAILRGGARVESRAGAALLAGRLLAEGTTRRDYKRISDEAEERGIALSGAAGFEGHGIVVDALSRDTDRALEWTAELLLESAFPEDRFDLLRRQAAAEIESLSDQADVLTGWKFLEQLYAPHPLSRRLQGDAVSLARLTPAGCAEFHQAALGAGLVVTVAGAIDEDATRRRLEAAFAGLRRSPPFAAPAAPDPSLPARLQVGTHAEDQAHLYLGHLTVDRGHPDLPALEVLSVILGAGAGLTGRIPQRIREAEGLAYTAVAAAASGAGLDAGRFVVYVGTSPETIERAEAAARDEIAKLLAEGLREDEVADAKSYLLGREPFRRETARQWADLLAESELYGLPVEDPAWCEARIRDLTRQDIDSAARRHIAPERLRVTVGLPTRG